MRGKACLVLMCVLMCAGLAQAELRAAIAVRNVTPDPLLPVSGGVGGSEPTKEKLGELNVRALVLDNDGARVALCSADFLGFPSVLGNKVRALVPGIPATNMLIGASHTHSAPDLYGFADRQGRTGADLKYIESVCGKLAEAINEAVDKLERAHVKIATGNGEGKIAYNYYADKLYDPRCSVIQVLDANDKPVATLVNYACHPEVIGNDQGILSPDFVGPLRDRIEAAGGGTGIFMNSALGGMVTADVRGPEGRDVQTWDECIRIGNLLADEALRIVSNAPVQANPKLFCGATTIAIPVTSPLMLQIVESSAIGMKLDDQGRAPAQVNVVNLGNAQILTIPGEALPNIGFYLKRKMYGEHNLLFGLTNDAFGYILVKEDWNSFERYNYISRTGLGEMTGEILIEQSLKFVDECPRPEAVEKK